MPPMVGENLDITNASRVVHDGDMQLLDPGLRFGVPLSFPTDGGRGNLQHAVSVDRRIRVAPGAGTHRRCSAPTGPDGRD